MTRMARTTTSPRKIGLNEKKEFKMKRFAESYPLLTLLGGLWALHVVSQGLGELIHWALGLLPIMLAILYLTATAVRGIVRLVKKPRL